MNYFYSPMTVIATPVSEKWPLRLREECGAAEVFVQQQAAEQGGIHTEIWPCDSRQATARGLEVTEEDLALGVIWVGMTKVFRSGKRDITVMLPPQYPYTTPLLFIGGISRNTTHHVLSEGEACLIPKWEPHYAMCCIVGDCLNAYAAEIGKVAPWRW